MPVAIGPAALDGAIDSDRRPVVVDVRPALEYTDAHVPTATLVPRRSLESRLPIRVPCRSTPLVICDRRGERAPVDAEWLEHLGYADVSYLDGGNTAWRTAGRPMVEAVDGVPTTALHVPSKLFGERVLADEGVPQLSPDELHRRLADDPENLLVVDVRTPDEHLEGAIPGAVNAEGVELAALAANRGETGTIVVHCAGRTRSIIGAATLRKLGIDDVYQLKNGTMGWRLAGYELSPGTTESIASTRQPSPGLESTAETLLAESGVERLSPADFAALLDVTDFNVYPVDVRTREEYDVGHLPGTLNVPGGQLIQRADHYIPDSRGRVALVSDETGRAAVTAYWLSEQGFSHVGVLDGGIEAWKRADRSLRSGPVRRSPLGLDRAAKTVRYVAPETLEDRRYDGSVRVIDVDASTEFRRRHVPGSEWVPRYHLDTEIAGETAEVILTCRDGTYSTLAAAAVAYRGLPVPSVLRGGLEAWEAAGLPTESGTAGLSREPRDVVPPPWALGRTAVRAYLDWEEALVGDDA